MSITTLTSIELESYNARNSVPWIYDHRSDETETGPHLDLDQHEINSLEPTDGGPAAWRLLFGAFLFEAVLWGKFWFSSPVARD